MEAYERSTALMAPALPEPALARPELERRLDEVLDRRLGIIVADAGFGKSTLAALWAAERQAAWHTLSPEDAQLERLAHGIVRALRLAVPSLPDDLPRGLRGARGPDAGREEAERAQIFAGVLCEALDEVLASDLVLVLDDLHAARGGPGAQLIEAISRQAGPHLHLLALSREPAPFAVERLRGQGQVIELVGGDLAFAPAEVAALVEAALGAADERLAEALHAGTGGWPAAIRLALESLRSIPASDRHRFAAGLREAGSPVFEYLAQEAFDRESPEVRELIRTASILESIAPDLGAALGLEAVDRLPGLARRGLFFDADPREPGWFQLRPLVRDFVAARHAPPDAERRDLVERAVLWLEGNGRIGGALRLLARGGDADGAARLIREHGESLLDAGDVDAVVAASGAILPERRDAAIELVVGRARQIRGEWEDALDCFHRAAGDADSLEAGLGWRMGLIHHFRGELEQAEAVYRRTRLEGAPPADAASLLAWHAALDWLMGRAEDCRARAERALELAGTAAEPRALACAHTVMAMLAALEGDRAANDAHYLRALEHAERAGDVLQVIRIRTNRGSRFMEEGAYHEALAEVEMALRLADLAGFAFFRALALCNRGQTRFMLGRFEEAAADFDQARGIYERMGSHDVSYPLAMLGDVHRERGALALARAAYEEALVHGEASRDLQALVPALAGLARTLAVDEPAEAAAHAERALASATGLWKVEALLAAGWVALVAGDAERATALAREASAEARSRRDRAGLAEALELEARALGDRRAGDLLREAIEIWQGLESPVGLLRAQLALAGIVSSDERAGLLDRAERTVREIGARAYAPAIARLRSTEGDGAPTPIGILTLGRFRVLRDGDPIPLREWQSKKARDLVKILVARRGRPVQREVVIEALWPGEDPGRVANRLSVALSTARSVLRGEHEDWQPIVANPDTVALERGAVELDVDRFLADAEAGLALGRDGDVAAARERLEGAEALYVGDFLEEDLYEDWSVPLREEARAAYVAVARALARDAADRGAGEAAERYLLRLLDKDPYDEDAHLELVRVLAAARRHGDARRAYRVYTARMAEIEVEAAPFPAAGRALTPP